MQDRDVNDNPFDFDLWTDGTTEAKNMQDVKLKPCPFCGGEAELVCTTDNHHAPYVRCKYGVYLKPKCTANMYPWRYKTAEEAIEAWNNRAEKTAKWVYAKYDYEQHKYIPDENLKKGTLVCSACLEEAYRDSDGFNVEFSYCPNCGAEMIVDV